MVMADEQLTAENFAFAKRSVSLKFQYFLLKLWLVKFTRGTRLTLFILDSSIGSKLFSLEEPFPTVSVVLQKKTGAPVHTI
jgi:uncharacterized protein (DUF2336 family)